MEVKPATRLDWRTMQRLPVPLVPIKTEPGTQPVRGTPQVVDGSNSALRLFASNKTSWKVSAPPLETGWPFIASVG